MKKKILVDFDSARLAHKIVTSGIRPWPAGTALTLPDQITVAELALYAAALVAPIAGLALVWSMFGNTAAVVAAPVALVVWRLLHKAAWQAKAPIRDTRARDTRVYDLVRELATRLDLTPAELTPVRLGIMTEMHLEERDKRAAAAEEARAARAEALRRSAACKPSRGVAAGAAGLAAGGAAGMAYDNIDTGRGYSATPDYDYDFDHYSSADHSYSPYPDVNPGSGLPMISGTPIDVGGHVFGSDF